MRITIRRDFNLDICTCRHQEFCLCTDAFYDLEVQGTCTLLNGDYVTQVDAVIGLPAGWTFSDMRPVEQQAIVEAVEDEFIIQKKLMAEELARVVADMKSSLSRGETMDSYPEKYAVEHVCLSSSLPMLERCLAALSEAA